MSAPRGRGRALATPLRLAWRRARRRPGRLALVALGVAAAAALATATLGASVLARDREVQRAIASLPLGDRTLRVDVLGPVPGLSYAQSDRAATAALRGVTHAEPDRVVAVKDLTIGGRSVRFVAVDDLARWAHLTSGRLPGPCTPRRCEVLQIGRASGPLPRSIGISPVRVGTAGLRDAEVLGSSFQATARGGQPAPLLLALSSVHALAALPALQLIYRTYGWVAPLAVDGVHVWSIDSLLARETRMAAALQRRSAYFEVTAPDQALLDARDAGRVAAERMLLVAGEVAALLLGFALVAAGALRRDLGDEWQRLERRGARRAQLWAFLCGEIGLATAVGMVGGALLGAAAVGAVAAAAGESAGSLASHALVTPRTLLVLAGGWLVAAGVVLAAVRADGTGPVGRVRPTDVAAVGALAAIAVGASRGAADAGSLSGGGASGLMLLLLPALVCLVGALVVARALRPALRAAERHVRSGPPALRLAVLALARAPSRTVAAACFLVIGVALALFAADYRATLTRGARDEAAFQVPLDFTLQAGPRLVTPFDVAPAHGYASLAPGTAATGVLRRFAEVAGTGTSTSEPAVLGLDPRILPALAGWRSAWSSASPAQLASRLASGRGGGLRGVALPVGTRRLELRAVQAGVPVALTLALRQRDGRWQMLLLHPGRRGLLAADVPAAADGAQLEALEIDLGTDATRRFAHDAAQKFNVTVPAGAITLAPLRAVARGGTRSVTDWRGWTTPQSGRADGPGRFAYSFPQGQTVVLRRPQPTDGRTLPVVVSPDVAAAAGRGGRLRLVVDGVPLLARVVATAARFPTTQDSGSFVVADRGRLSTTLDAYAPGTGVADEVWLRTPAAATRRAVADALAQPPFDVLAVSSRAAAEAALVRDPLARGLTLTLATAAGLALVLALAGLWLSVASDVRDEAGELYDLEAQGASPRLLRTQLRLRAVLVTTAGLLGGVALGALLAVLVTRLVEIGVAVATPVPPLVPVVDWALAGAGLALFVLLAAAVVELTLRRTLRGGLPRRAGEADA